MKQAFAVFFLFVFSFQILPVKELGRFLFKNSLTEEVAEAEYGTDDTSEESNIKLKKEGDPYHNTYFTHHYKPVSLAVNALKESYTPRHISKQFIPDILTPPPDYRA